MSLVNEITYLLNSDVSSLGVEQLTSKFGLFVRNTAIHYLSAFAATFAYFHYPLTRRPLALLLISYVILQAVQLLSPGSIGALAVDGLWDILMVGLGISCAWHLAMRSPERGI